MKTTLSRFGALLAVVVLSTGGLLRADDVQGTTDSVELTSNHDESEDVGGDLIAATYATDAAPVKPQPNNMASPGGNQSACGCCGQCGGQCNGCNNCNNGNNCNRFGKRFRCPPYSELCPQIGIYTWSGVDSFKGITTGNLNNNNGGVTGLNVGGALLEDWGIGWQAGGSYGVYNFMGNGSSFAQTGEATQQGFITIGLFQRANANRHFSWGVVHDWMISNNFGVFGNSMTLGQWRSQWAWAFSAKNEVGVWATVQDRSVTRATGAIGTPVAYQAIDQGNLFWHHKYALGADSWFYAGVPLDGRIATAGNSAGFPVGGFGGSIGSFIVGTNWLIPLNNNLSGYANAMYMRPSASEGVNAAGNVATAQEFWNLGAGLAWYPGRAARSATVAGRAWMPYIPVANNGTFLVDSTKTE